MRCSIVATALLATAAIAAPALEKIKRDAGVKVEFLTLVVTEYQTAIPTGHRRHRHRTRLSKTFISPVGPTAPPSDYYPEPTPTPGLTTPTPSLPTTTPTPTPPTTTPTPIAFEATPSTTSSATPTPTPAAGGDSFAAAVLKAHNDKRALHGVGELTWDATMATFAQGVSGKCVFQHSGGPYGENLAAGYASPAAGIQAWYDEEKLYNYAAGQFDEATGHFTQVVWKAATKVGCASVTCDGKDGTPGDFLTCNYDTGNVIGQFVQNVLPLV